LPLENETTPAPVIRVIREHELPQLLQLYQHLHPQDAPLPPPVQLQSIWANICANPNLQYVVAEVDGRIVSSCALAIIANLTRGARPYALIENVITHPDFRCRGLGTALLKHTAQIARSNRCYKIMLLSGSKRAETLSFYERVGFLRNVKTGFVMPLD
jgi:GNAT superfamily N-acetyltransferase